MFQNGGLAASMVSLLCAAWVACDNMIVLIRVAEKTGKNSYGQVGGLTSMRLVLLGDAAVAVAVFACYEVNGNVKSLKLP